MTLHGPEHGPFSQVQVYEPIEFSQTVGYKHGLARHSSISLHRAAVPPEAI